MLAFNVNPGIQFQALYRVFNAMLIRLVFKEPFWIESQLFKFKEICIAHSQVYVVFIPNVGIQCQDLNPIPNFVFNASMQCSLGIQCIFWD